MSISQTPGTHTFLIHAPYQTDEGMVGRRAVVRPAHLAKATELKANGFLRASYLSALLVYASS